MQAWLDSLRGLLFSDAYRRVQGAGYVPLGPTILASQEYDKARAIYLHADPSAREGIKEPVVWYAELAFPR